MNNSLGIDVERSALQALRVFRLLYSWPDGLGYLNEWPFGPEDRSSPSLGGKFD